MRSVRRFCVLFVSLMCTVLLASCRTNSEPTVVTVVVTTAPTATLAPLITFTPQFTATLPPTQTPIPSQTPDSTETPTSEPPTDLPTLTPTASILGTVNFSTNAANLRAGPGLSYSVVAGIKAGTRLIVLGTNTDKDWYNVRLEDGSHEGWLSINLVTVSGTGVPILSTDDFIQRTQISNTQTALGSAGNSGGTDTSGTPVASRKPGVISKTDVLAYCDSKTHGEARKTLAAGTPVTVYWSWFAKTASELADQISYGNYEVNVDGQLLKDWRNYKTDVIRNSADGNYYVYWYVAIGTPLPGEHTIDFKLTWQQAISDGYKKYGPGTDEEQDIGSCVFTIK